MKEIKKERTLLEGIGGTWFYHLSQPENPDVALCGELRIMRSLSPESTWGFKGNAGERYCKKCEALKKMI